MGVAVGHRDTGGQSLDDYAHDYDDRHGTTPQGMERFVIDVWPEPVSKTRDAQMGSARALPAARNS